MYRKLKKSVFDIIQPAGESNLASKVFDLVILTLIVISVASVFILTFNIPEYWVKLFQRIEFISVIVFTAEYLLRIWTADLLYPESSFFGSRLKYMRSFMALIDLLAILPFYLPMILPVNLIGIRAFRLVRLLRILKLNRYSDSLLSIAEVFRRKSKDIAASLFFIGILLFTVSLLIYYVEHDAQPDKFENAFSGLWWAVATLTTIGYGDIYPITVGGRILGTFIAILGIGMVAVPTGILSSGFVENLGKKDEAEEEEHEEIHYCPHCGKKLK